MSKILEENVVDIEKVIYGESIQDGIPTPDNPVEIKSKKIFNSNYIQRVNDIQCPLLVAISQEEYAEYKSLENQLKQRDEVIDECIESIQNFMTHIDDGFCADMMTFIDILNKYKGDNK